MEAPSLLLPLAAAPPRRTAEAPGPALVGAVEQVLTLLGELLAHREALGEAALAIETAIATIRARLAREHLVVAITGEKKAGKSTFLNAILGAPVLSAAVRECTGTVTRIAWGEAPGYEARLADGRIERFEALYPSYAADYEAAEREARTQRQAFEADGEFPWEAPPAEASAYPEEAAAWRAIEAARSEGVGALQAAWTAFLTARCRRTEAQRTAYAAYRAAQFAAEVAALTDMNGRGADVLELSIRYPGRFLPRGLTILDTPGANTDHEANQARAWGAIREEADGCVLLSDLQQVMSRSTREFLAEMRRIVPHVLLVLTKQDRALLNADEDDPAAQLEEARRIGIRRFAEEMGRAPEEILSLTVAAEPALRAQDPDSPALRRFEAEIAHMFALLRTERALILGAWAAGALKTCLARIEAAQGQAEAHYRRRIAQLEAQRITRPEAFLAEALGGLRPRIGEPALMAAEATTQHFRAALARLRAERLVAMRDFTSKEALQAALPGLAEALGRSLETAIQQARGELVIRLRDLIDEGVEGVLEEFQARYRLAQEGTDAPRALTLDFALPAFEQQALDVRAGLTGALSEFERDAIKFKAGGAAAGAALGSLFFPGLGTLAGAVIGSMADRLLPLEMLREDCEAQITRGLDRAEAEVVEQLRAPREANLLAQLEGAIQAAMGQFDAAIAALLAEETHRIAQANETLWHLVGLKGELDRQVAAIDALRGEAIAASRGLAG